MVCPSCDALLPDGLDSCPECHHASPPAVTLCQACSEQIAADSESCPACGWLRQPMPCAIHPERQALGECVVCGRVLCAACDRSRGRPFLCATHKAIPVIQGWAQVYSTSDEIEAELIRDNLHAEGIDAEVFSQKDHFTFTVDLGDLSPVRVLVPAFRFEEARMLIRDHMDARGEVLFACLGCGEAFEPGDEVCAHCGDPLP